MLVTFVQSKLLSLLCTVCEYFCTLLEVLVTETLRPNEPESFLSARLQNKAKQKQIFSFSAEVILFIFY